MGVTGFCILGPAAETALPPASEPVNGQPSVNVLGTVFKGKVPHEKKEEKMGP
jgi:hypothetical protein